MPAYSLAATAIVWKDDQREEVLMMKHHSDQPHGLMGEWFFPGGIVEVGEQPKEAAEREVLEETHVQTRDLVLLDVCTYLETWQDKGEEKSVWVALAIYEGYWASGEAKLSEETADVAWVHRDDLGKVISEKISSSYLSPLVRERLGMRE